MSTFSPSGLPFLNNTVDSGSLADDLTARLNERLGAAIVAPDIVGLTGGGATKLDGIPTPDLALGVIIHMWNGTSMVTYRLRAGTDAEASPTIIRPDDYAGGTNERVWEKLAFGFAPAADSVYLEGTHAVTNAWTDVELEGFPDVPLEITLPSAGKYLIMVNLELLGPTSVQYDNILAKVLDDADAEIITPHGQFMQLEDDKYSLALINLHRVVDKASNLTLRVQVVGDPGTATIAVQKGTISYQRVG